MRGVRGWRVGTVACATLLLLYGCSGDNADPPPSSSPLAEVLGWGMAADRAGVPEISEVERERQERVEQLTAACMDDRGFEYVPVPPEERIAGPYDDAYALDPDEFADRYGYGATTLPEPDRTATDPNLQLLDTMPEGERRAYQRALWGEAVTASPAGSEDGDAWDKGCQERANREVYGSAGAGGVVEGQARFETLFAELNRLWERIENDPRLADANENWSACVADAGFPRFDRPHEAQQSVFDRLAGLPGEAESGRKQAMAQVRDYELALAPVDHACRDEHIDGPRRAVAYELEAQFVAEHRAELEEYRDWVGGIEQD